MPKNPAVTKAVVPVAGLGTRFLPATKAIPKEMLPVVDKPAIQYVVEEAAAAGLNDILLVTGRGKGAIEDHFDRAPELEQALEAKGDDKRLARVREPDELAMIHSIRQGAPRGLGHAVLCAAKHVGDHPFAVLLGDDFIHPSDPLLQRMIEVRGQYGGSVVALMQVDSDQVSQYGVVAAEPTDTDGVVTVTDLVEKPAPADAPSNWIVIGRYVCDPAIFGVLERTAPGRGGEIQLTDALKTLAQMPAGEGGGVRGVQFRGRRFDTGNPADYLRTIVQFACERPDIAAEFIPWLRKYLDDLA
jgi:UTP--glucose-1-phosphate uridylyltransferase